MKKNNIIFIGLILLAGFIRLIPHPWNFTPLLAACIFSGSKIKSNGLALFVPLLSIFLSDMYIGLYSGMVWVYSGYILTILISVYLGKSNTLNSKLLNVAIGSLIFFIISNFGVWISGLMYPLNFVGFSECYIAAIPFYKNTLLGTIIYSGVFFGIAEILERKITTEMSTAKS